MSPVLKPPRLQAGDRVKFVSPASTPTREGVRRGCDINDALRNPGIRAIFATTGGRGAYRIADGLDFDAARRDPKPLVGFSDITILHLARWDRCRVVGFHGPHVDWIDEYYSTRGVAAELENMRRQEPGASPEGLPLGADFIRSRPSLLSNCPLDGGAYGRTLWLLDDLAVQ